MNLNSKKRILFKNVNEDFEISLDGPPLDFSNLELENINDLISEDFKKDPKKKIVNQNSNIQNEKQEQQDNRSRRKTIMLVNIAKKRSTFQTNSQKQNSQKNQQINKKENKIPKLKPIDNIKKVIEYCDTDLETNKVHQKAIQKNKKRKVLLKTTSLFIGYNQIKSIQNCVPIFEQLMPNCFYDLQWLDLQHNQIEQLDESLNQLKNLKTLYLHCNFIFDLNEFLKLKNLIKLRSLMIHGNPIVRIPNFRYYFIEIFPNLKKLDTVLVTNKERDNSQVWIYQFKKRKLPCYDINSQSII